MLPIQEILILLKTNCSPQPYFFLINLSKGEKSQRQNKDGIAIKTECDSYIDRV